MENTMKKIAIALALAATTFCVITPASAQPHHRECHKVKVHHHWEKRCH
jgi:hypothetical protein